MLVSLGLFFDFLREFDDFLCLMRKHVTCHNHLL